jgi:hypothetical protein
VYQTGGLKDWKMVQMYVDRLADELTKSLDKSPNSGGLMSEEGTALVTKFVQEPGVREWLNGLDILQKVRLWGAGKGGLQILLHGAETAKKGGPHDHGSSWALYYQVTGITVMTTYRRMTGLDGEPGEADLEVSGVQELTPGNAMYFGPNVIHSTEHPSPPARWIRLTGVDLDHATRLRFSLERKEAVLD